MRKQLLGIGNALVDIEFEVSDDFLRVNNLVKGRMSLIDEKTHHSMLQSLKKEHAVKQQTGGGSAANSAVVFSQLGGTAAYYCWVADDSFGHFYTQDLQAQGVYCEPTFSDSVTGKCLVLITPDAERTMLTYLGATADLSVADLNFSQIQSFEWLFMEGYLVTMPNSFEVAKEAIKQAKKYGTKIALSCSDPFVVSSFRSQLSELLSLGVDLLFANEEEVQLYSDPQDWIKKCDVISEHCQQLVVTLGHKGCAIYSQGTLNYYQGIDTKVVDTNGAGDAFAGAFLYAVTKNWSDQRAAQLSNRVAATVISHFGARSKKSLIQAEIS